MKIDDLTEEQKLMMLATLAAVSLAIEKTGAPFDDVGSAVYKLLGGPEPTPEAEELRADLIDGIKSAMTVVDLHIEEPPENFTKSERAEHVLSQMVAGMRKLTETKSKKEDDTCDCNSCVSRRNMMAQVENWETAGEPLINHQEEILAMFREIGVPAETITSMFHEAGADNPYQHGQPLPDSSSGRVLH